jgi:hypothetical protein
MRAIALSVMFQPMNKLIILIFRITDVLAWVLVVASVLSVLVMPFSEPEHYALKGMETPWDIIGVKAICNLLLAVGFYLYVKRKVIAFIFISLAFVGAAVVTNSLFSIWAMLGVLALFGLPWVLSAMDYKRGNHDT